MRVVSNLVSREKSMPALSSQGLLMARGEARIALGVMATTLSNLTRYQNMVLSESETQTLKNARANIRPTNQRQHQVAGHRVPSCRPGR